MFKKNDNFECDLECSDICYSYFEDGMGCPFYGYCFNCSHIDTDKCDNCVYDSIGRLGF